MALPAVEIQITADPKAAEAGFAKIERSQKALDAATQQYQASLARLAAAEKQGLIPKQKLARAINEIEREYEQAGQAAAQYVGATAQLNRANVAAAGQMTAMGNSIGAANASTTNLMFQFQDIGMMLAAGQSPLMLALQQGTQVSGVFHQMQQNGQSAFSGIIGGLRAMINPMSLLTIGTIAAGAALTQWAMSAIGAGEDARELEDALEELNDIAGEMEAALDVLNTSAFEMADRYGILAERVRELAREELLLAEIRARQAVQDEIASIGDLDRAYQGALRSGNAYRNAMSRIERDFGLSGAAAENLAGAMALVSDSRTPDEYVGAMNALRAVLDENGVSLSEIPLELQEAIGRANGLEMAMINVAAASSNAAAEVEDMVAALPMTVGVGLSGDASQFLPSAATLSSGGRQGGGGGGGGGQNPLQAEFEALRESLMGQEELQLASFERQQEALQYALENRLLTQQEYNAMMEEAQRQHQEAMSSIDVYRYGTGLQQTEQFMGDMAQALANGGEETVRISKIFGAAQALIAAYTGAAEALKLPFPQNLGAFAAVLGQGLSAVQAIKSVSAGSGTASAGGAAGAAQQAGGQQAPRTQSEITLVGEFFSPEQVGRLLNEYAAQGGRVDGDLIVRTA